MATSLTAGAITRMCSLEGRKENDWNPVVQVIDIRMVNSTGAPPAPGTSERFRVRISDGRYWQQGMLASQINQQVHDGKLQRGSLVRLLEIVTTPVQGRLIILIVGLEVVTETCDIIGNPEAISKSILSPSPGSVTGKPLSPAGARPSPGLANESVPGMSSFETPGANRLNSGPYSNNTRYGTTNMTPMNNRQEPGYRSYGMADPPPTYGNHDMGTRDDPSSFSGPYGNRNPSLHSTRPEVSRVPPNSYGGAPQSTYQQPPPMYNNRGPVAKNEAPSRIIPISALNPYQSRWTIKARVTAKQELKHYTNARGEGKVFSFDLLDAEGGEIRVTCFNAVADQFYNEIEAGNIYTISRGSLKPAQKNFNHLRNDHEIFLESTSVIQPCFEEDSLIPRVQFHFCSIRDIEAMDNNAIVDIIGVVTSISPAGSILRKNGTETQKRSLQLKDVSGRSVELTLWGNFCSTEGQRLQNICDSGNFPVLALKAGRVTDFNGKSVGTISSSQLLIEPDSPEASRLREWFEREGRNIPAVSISRESGISGRVDIRKTISQIKDENLGTSEKPDWITVSATVSFIKVDNFCYTACPQMNGDRQCNKKVANNGDGKWRCDKCDQSVDECDYRYILQLQIQDHTGLTWVTAFQEGGEEVMGVPAKVLYDLKYEEQDDVKFAEIVRKVLFTKFTFKLKVKEEIYNDEQRVKSTVVKAERTNHVSESKYLLDQMEKLKREDSGLPAVKEEPSLPTNTAAYRQSAAGSGRGFGIPANQAGQYGNQYSGSRSTPTASAGMYLSCNSCGATGHSSVNCPSIANSPAQPMGGSYGNRASSGIGNVAGECFKCHQTGHWARDCPGSSNAAASYGGGGGGGVAGRYGGQHVGGF